MKHKLSSTTRRSFLKTVGGTGLGLTVLPSYLALTNARAQQAPPSKRLNLGCIGFGGRASSMIPSVTSTGEAVPIAYADIDQNQPHMAKNLKAYPDAKPFTDFRVMLDKMGKDIDAVTVATPDHVHFVAVMEAMRRGKHVYVEKPLAHSFAECEMLMKAEKKYGVVTQMGNQGHTSAGSAQFKTMVEKGLAKDITRIEAYKGPSLFFMQADKRIKGFPPEEPLPEKVDWELWCGPAEKKPYSKLLHPFNWRAFYLYGNGMLGDWGAHIIDFAHDYLNLGLPTTIKAIKMGDHNDVLFPLTTHLTMHFPERGPGLPACDLTWRDGDGCTPELAKEFWDTDKQGQKVEPKLGKAGTLLYRTGADFVIHRGSHGDPSKLFPKVKHDEQIEIMKTPKMDTDHGKSFVKACLGQGKTWSPFSVAAPLSQVLMLGVICQRLNASEVLEFDPKAKQFKKNDRANALLQGPPPRKGWEEYYRLV